MTTPATTLPNGKQVSRIVLGGDRWQGRRWLLVPSAARRRQWFSLLDAALEMGVTTFDTARAYGDSERVLGEWVQSRRNRDHVILCTKLGCPKPNGASRLSPAEIRADFEQSLRALNTDAVDLLFVHYDDPSVPVEPILRELERFVERGQAIALGASNWTYPRIAEANRSAADQRLTPFAVASAHLGLAPWVNPPWPGAVQLSGPDNAAARAYFAEQQMPVFVWSSLSFGLYADAYDPENPTASFRSRWIARTFGSTANHETLQKLRQFARQSGTSPVQLALAFVLHQPFPTHAIVGCRTPDKLRHCVDAAGMDLPADVRELG